MRLAFASSAAPVGWSPAVVAPGSSTRGAGLLRAGFDAWRGVPELSRGVALTDVQVALLAPFLAAEQRLDAARAAEDLRAVRIHVGGAAHGAGGVATTIGRNIYVSDSAHAIRLLSWPGRAWLAHELAHTMQWRRVGERTVTQTDADRDRAFLESYVGAFVTEEGRVDRGGFAQAWVELVRRHRAGEPIGSLPDLVHDAHPMEREAARVAGAFRTAHP